MYTHIMSFTCLLLLLAGQADQGLLMRALGDLPGGVKVSGWADGSFTASSARADQSPMGFNYRANDFLLQQAWLRVERPVDKDAGGPSLGFRSDTFLGSDYRYTVARGLFDRQLTDNNGEPATYGVDPVQFYGEVWLPDVAQGLSLKAGRFFAQFGAENTDTTQNALPSRSYTFIYNPFTHTGLLATVQLDDAWSAQAGLVLGSDVFIDPAARPTFIGSVKWAPKDGRHSLLEATVLGPGRFETSQQFNNPQILDVVYTFKPTKEWAYTFEGLVGWQSGVPANGAVTWFGLVNYLTYTFHDRVSATGRLEFFDDVDGSRTGFRGLYTGLTAGLTWKASEALWLRPEVRCDNNSDSRPFEGRSSLFTACLDVVLRW